MSRTYVVHTYGCQMNEHDSERIAGLLEADGLTPAAAQDEADVVVVNTCCIRENADNKLYGNLGWLKSWKAQRSGRQIVVAGCLAQKDRDVVATKAPWVDVVMGTHNVHRAAQLLGRSRTDGPVTEIFDEAVIDDHALFPSALPVRRETSYNAWVTIQIGCDNSCAFCIVPSVRGKEISRPFAEIVAEVEQLAAQGVTEITLLGQNVNSYGRDLQLAARRDGAVGVRARPLFSELLAATGSVAGIRRVRFTSPHPKDMLPDTFAAMAATPSVCEHLHYPLQSGSDRILAAMHRGYTAERYLRRLGQAREAVPDLAVSTDIIVGFPGETDDDFARTLEVAAAADYDYAYTFVYSPRAGTEAAQMSEHFVAPAVTADRFERLRIVVERSALTRHRARVGRVEEVLVEGPSRKTPPCSPAAPARTSWSMSPRRGGAHRRLRRRRDHVRRAPPPPRPVRRAARRADAPAAHSGPVRMTRPIVIAGATASGKSDLAMALAAERPGAEIIAVDSMQVYRGMDIGTAKPTAADRQAVRHHCLDLVAPEAEFTVADFSRCAGSALADIAERGAQAVLVAGTGLYLRAVTDPMEIPRRWPQVRDELERRLAHEGAPALHHQLARLDPRAADRMDPNNPRRVVRALEVTLGSGRPFSSFGPGLDHYPEIGFTMVGLALGTDGVGGADRAARAPDDRSRSRRRGPPVGTTSAGMVPNGAPGARVQGAARTPRRACRAGPGHRRGRPAHPPVRGASGAMVPAGPTRTLDPDP
jgi:tRNA-2-methylthio-N6-dimethylallyladenosine synthase